MKFSIRHADKIVGLFVILALAILIFVILMLGRNQRWFAQDPNYKTYFISANGISPNMAILYKGFTIGHVKSIDLADNDLVEINFTIFEEYAHRVTDGSLVEVSSSPIPGLGGGFNFHPGKGTELIPNGGFIPEINSIEARQLRMRGLTDVSASSDNIGNILNQVNALLETVNTALAGPQNFGETPLEQIISNIERTTNNIDVLTGALPGQVNQIVSSLPELILDIVGSLLNQINPILNDLNAITGQVASVLETVDTALAGSQNGTALGQIISNIEKTTNNIDTLTGALPEQVNTLTTTLPEQVFGVIDSLTAQIFETVDSLTTQIFEIVDSLTQQINPIFEDIGNITGQITSVAEQVASPSGAVMSLLDGDGPLYTGIASSISSISGIIDSLNETVKFIPSQLPQVTVIINELSTVLRSVQDVLTAVANNPLLKGGIPDRSETGPGGASPRNLDF